MSAGVTLYVYKQPGGLLAAADEDAEGYLKKMTVGEVLELRVRKPRNYLFHKKFFALLKIGFSNQDKYEAMDPFRAEVTMRAGWYTEHHHVTGKISYQPKSISFDKMDELEFGKLYQAAIDVILQHFIPGMTEAGLQAAVAEEVARFAA